MHKRVWVATADRCHRREAIEKMSVPFHPKPQVPVDEGVLDIELGNRVHDFREFRSEILLIA